MKPFELIILLVIGNVRFENGPSGGGEARRNSSMSAPAAMQINIGYNYILLHRECQKNINPYARSPAIKCYVRFTRFRDAESEDHI